MTNESNPKTIDLEALPAHIVLRCAIPLELHRRLRSVLALRGEKVYEWMIRMAEEEVRQPGPPMLTHAILDSSKG